MLFFVLQKLRSKKWMVLSLLLGNLLLVAIACANPMYTRATLQKTLQTNLTDYMTSRNRYPGAALFSASMTRSKDKVQYQDNFYRTEELAQGLPQALGLPEKEFVVNYYMENVVMASVSPREDAKGEKRLSLGFLSDIGEHCSLLDGELPSSSLSPDGVIDVLVSEKGLINMNLLLGEELAISSHTAPDGSPLTVRICGVFENADDQDPYWVRTPTAYSNTLLMDEDLFRELFVSRGEGQRYSLKANWYSLVDYTAMQGQDAQTYLDVMAQVERSLPSDSNANMTNYFTETLTSYVTKAQKVSVTLLVLQTPIFVLLAAFIFMVSRQMLSLEEGEIAVLKSRGASKRQILFVYLLQSLLLALLSLVLGLPLGLYLCQVLGSANAFLEFVQRTALPVSLDLEVLLYGLAAALVSIAAMVVPVLRYADVSIVNQKRAKQRNESAPLWQKLFLDVVLLGVALYGLYSFNAQKELLYLRVLDGASLDPLLFLSSSLFIIGAGLVSLRILPLLVRVVYLCFQKHWSPALFASFLRVLRTRGQGFIMVFLMFTIALGMFNAAAARTINENEEKSILYSIGADLVVQEAWSDNSQQLAEDSLGASDELTYIEPDFGKYESLEGIVSITKVLNDDDIGLTLPSGSSLRNVQLMGIHTKEFGETAWFDESLLPVHWYEYLNAMSQNASAVLLSENMQALGYELGDVLYYRNGQGKSARGIVYGFVPYWPGYTPTISTKGSDGLYKETEQYLIVAHLSQLQASFGITPYELWIRTDGSTRFLYDFAEETGVKFVSFKDASAELVQLKNDPIFQGTNGILTVSFIVVLLLCTTGFLIYWILSIRSRALQMGIFRAMGMRMGEILTMLCNEQICISALSIGMGAVIGYLASRLYIPLIQIAYAASDRMLPLNVVLSPVDNLRLFSIVGGVMVFCLLLLGLLVSKMKISQALKLGED